MVGSGNGDLCLGLSGLSLILAVFLDVGPIGSEPGGHLARQQGAVVELQSQQFTEDSVPDSGKSIACRLRFPESSRTFCFWCRSLEDST